MELTWGTGRTAALRGWALVGVALALPALLWSSRVLAISPPAGLEEGPRQGSVLATPDPAGASAATTYLHLQADGRTPVTWSPCRPIHYVVRPDGMPAGGLQILQDAIGQVSAFTGLRFVYDGPTDETVGDLRKPYQRSRYGDRWAPALIVWGDPSYEGGYTGGVPLAGWAGPYPAKAADGHLVYVTGSMDLDAAWSAQMIAARGSQYVGAVVQHEMGHLVGLDHAPGDGKLMSAHNVGALQYSPDELRGLESLGAGPCHRDV